MCKYVIIDLEMCKVPNQMKNEKYQWPQETIQIGAVLLSESLEVEDSFNTYVSPQYGHIDTFIKTLTGISPKDVKNAPVMKEALQSFTDWFPDDAIAVSWSNSDKSQILHEVEAKNIVIEGLGDILDRWMDCQKIFGEKMHSKRRYKLSEALVAADIKYEEGVHNGLVDAYNTALLFAKMEKEPELNLNSYYRNAIMDESQSSHGYSIGSLFQNFDLESIVTA